MIKEPLNKTVLFAAWLGAGDCKASGAGKGGFLFKPSVYQALKALLQSPAPSRALRGCQKKRLAALCSLTGNRSHALSATFSDSLRRHGLVQRFLKTLEKNVPQHDGLSRAERKAKTRDHILGAVWELIAEGRSLDSLGLREVARAAGLAAPSLYNHFPDMESLGIAMLDQACFRLRRWMGEGRRELIQVDAKDAITVMVRRFVEYMEDHEAEFRLLVQQRTGSHALFRRRIHHELHLAVEELGDDFRKAVGQRVVGRASQLEAEASAAILLGFGIQSLGMTAQVRHQQIPRIAAQLEMVVAGANIRRR